VAKGKGAQVIKSVLVDTDYFTLALLGGLFIVIGGLTQVGVIDRISSFICELGSGQCFCRLHRYRLAFGCSFGLCG